MSQWTARLESISSVTSVQLTWKISNNSAATPASVQVLTSDDGDVWKPAATVQLIDALPDLKTPLVSTKSYKLSHRIPLDNALTQHIRLQMTDTTPSSAGFHGLCEFVANTVDTKQLHTTSRDTLFALERLLHNAATGDSSSPSTARLAVRGLQGLSLASGSVNGVLRLLEVLLGDAKCITVGSELHPELGAEVRAPLRRCPVLCAAVALLTPPPSVPNTSAPRVRAPPCIRDGRRTGAVIVRRGGRPETHV